MLKHFFKRFNLTPFRMLVLRALIVFDRKDGQRCTVKGLLYINRSCQQHTNTICTYSTYMQNLHILHQRLQQQHKHSSSTHRICIYSISTYSNNTNTAAAHTESAYTLHSTSSNIPRTTALTGKAPTATAPETTQHSR